MESLPSNPTDDVRRLNPHLYKDCGGKAVAQLSQIGSGKRLRQSEKPLMNKLEQAFYDNVLLPQFGKEKIRVQAVTFRLCNGLRYTPDFVHLELGLAWETKGKWVDGDSFPKLKMAAEVYPELEFNLVSKKDGKWVYQRIFPVKMK